jgi:hypothetical protein
MSERIPHPEADEYAPFYAPYVEAVGDRDVLTLLARQPGWLSTLLAPLSDAEANARYAPGKWSIRQVVGHLTDTERVMAYRALRVSRDDPTPMAGFDENAFVDAATFETRPLGSLLAEFDAVRASNLFLLRYVPADAWARRGTANGREVSLRALAYVMAGHVEHHIRILRERYGVGSALVEPPAG